MSRGSEVDAGAFSDWLRAMRAVLRDEQGADVPCGDCVGCCVSSYPIPLRPSDVVAQEQVPEQFVLHGPHRPGHMLMGYRDDGTCPFLSDRSCSIYGERPQSCRDYDCRIYAATGLLPAGERPLISARVQAWRFAYPRDTDHCEQAAVLQAAQFLCAWSDRFPAGMRAGTPTATAVLAIKTYEVFMDHGECAVETRTAQLIAAARRFDRHADD
ncbi:MAG: YkgJ family cysteine cluster protein [Steroidobacteraceae bacterium]